MGNSSHRVNHKPQPPQPPNDPIAPKPIPTNNQLKCPRCHILLPPGTPLSNYADHIRGCIQAHNIAQNSSNVPASIANHPIILAQQQIGKGDNVQYEKVPVDYSMTKFKWEKKPIKNVSSTVSGMSAPEAKKLSFQQKQYWFRSKLQKKRISWQKGADFMKLQRSNILMSSLIEYKKVNMHKEVKIEFLGEKVNDAGGLLREWIHMVIKQVFDDSTGIFTVAHTDDVMYRVKWDEDLDQEFSVQLFELFGTILGKAIFERIPIQSYLDRTILRQLCSSPVKIQDIYGYDKQLYKHWTYILEAENLEDLEIYFTIPRDTSGTETIQEIELMPGGKDIQVTNSNKFQFVDLCIQVQTMNKVKRSLEAMSKGVSRVIPQELLTIFEPFQLEMILYGVPFIDVREWKQHTVYKAPYSQSYPQVRWFWKILQSFDQDQLANILHFCTGSSRTPIHGFKKLESNRGNYSKFMIESAPLVKTNPYPKGHTCFNRLELPLYPNQETMTIYITAISKSNLDGIFGLD